jgi:hypothetical protein
LDPLYQHLGLNGGGCEYKLFLQNILTQLYHSLFTQVLQFLSVDQMTAFTDGLQAQFSERTFGHFHFDFGDKHPLLEANPVDAIFAHIKHLKNTL